MLRGLGLFDKIDRSAFAIYFFVFHHGEKRNKCRNGNENGRYERKERLPLLGQRKQAGPKRNKGDCG